MKSQVTIEYKNGKAKRIHTILMSIQHDEKYNKKEFKEYIKKEIMDKVAKKYNLNTDFKVLINPTGKFVIGGPEGDAGVTGRKIIVDTYGGYAPHGGGAFSGKDPTKVDRSAAYMARYLAKNIVASGIAKECLIQLSYAIGVEEPISIYIDCKGTNKVETKKITKAIYDNFDLSPKGIIEKLDLRKPIYRNTCNGGHFGRRYLDDDKKNECRNKDKIKSDCFCKEMLLARPSDKQTINSGWITESAGKTTQSNAVLGSNDYVARTGTFTGGANGIFWIKILDSDDNTVVVRNITERAKNKMPAVTKRIEKDIVYPLLTGNELGFWEYSYSNLSASRL